MSLDAPEFAASIAQSNPPVWAGLRRSAFLLDQAIGVTCEAIGAMLVLAEVSILFAGVVSRYLLDSPLFWTDELANFLFLWLSMLGMVVALRRDGHMRLTTLANWMPPDIARWFAAVASLVVIAFVLEILLPAAQYLDQQRYVELISLQISDGYRVVAILVGAGLAATIALFRLLETTTWRSFGLALLTVGGIAALLWIGQPLLLAMGFGSLIVFFVVIVAACVGIGVPIAFAFGIATLSYLGLTSSMPLSVVVNRMDEGMSNLLLLSVPMFVFLGLLMEMTGIARVMVAFLAALVGHVRGGLSYVLLGAMYLVSGISGSKAADMAAVAPVLFPEMQRRGSHPGELAALLASSSAMSETIPPSLVLITVGSVTNVSITALFTGGLLPAAVAALALVVVSWYRSRHMDISGGERAPPSQILRTLVIAVPGLTLPFVIRAAVIDGIATATEVSTVGVVYTALLGILVYQAIRLAAHLSDFGGYRLAHRRGDADHRHRHGDGLGADAVGFLPMARCHHGVGAGREGGIPGDHRDRVRHSWQCPGGNSGDRAVRPAAVSGRQGDGRARGALRDGDHPGDGHRAVRAAVRRWVLRCVRDRAGFAGRCAVADVAVSGGAGGGAGDCCGGAVVVDRVPVMGGARADFCWREIWTRPTFRHSPPWRARPSAG